MAHHRDVSAGKNTLAVGPGRLAGDGTVIEVACSHYNLLKEESVRSRVSKAKARHQQAPQEQQGETQRQLDKALICSQRICRYGLSLLKLVTSLQNNLRLLISCSNSVR